MVLEEDLNRRDEWSESVNESSVGEDSRFIFLRSLRELEGVRPLLGLEKNNVSISRITGKEDQRRRLKTLLLYFLITVTQQQKINFVHGEQLPSCPQSPVKSSQALQRQATARGFSLFRSPHHLIKDPSINISPSIPNLGVHKKDRREREKMRDCDGRDDLDRAKSPI